MHGALFAAEVSSTDPVGNPEASTGRGGPSVDRTASRDVRRRQLIESTVAEIAEAGFSGLTIASVAKRAGLASGTVTFHFTSKAQLLDATLDHLAEEYRLGWRGALEAAGSDPAKRLRAMMMADLHPRICNRRRIAVWHAFYGEARARPAYFARCARQEEERRAELAGLCRLLMAARNGAGGMSSEHAAAGLGALMDGIWTGLLLGFGRIDRSTARRTVDSFLALVFPEAFAPNVAEGASA